MPVDAGILWRIVVAAAGGLAVGLEREWSGHFNHASPRFAGIRTFAMIGLIAGLSGWWWSAGLVALAAVLLGGTTGIILLAYLARSRTDVDATTEVAAVVVLAAGVMAGAGQTTMASGIVALTVLLLAEKTKLHTMVARLGETELLAAARFAVMATVILPLLPEELGPLGPLGLVRPRLLWILVLFFSALSFAGFLARRAFGGDRGYAVAGVLGGMVSSTSVALTFSRLSRRQKSADRALASGTVGASVMLFPRVLLASMVLAPTLAAALWPAFVAPVVIGLILVARGIRDADGATRESGPGNPLELRAALQMTLLFQFVLFGVNVAESWFGNAGLYASSAVLGLTDVDALTVSMAQRAAGGTPPDVAATALTVGVLANTLVKISMAAVIGKGHYRVLASAGLATMAAALVVWLIV